MNQLQFTIKERLIIYEKALDIYKNTFKESVSLGLCYAMDTAIIKLYNKNLEYNELYKLLPEFYDIKPINVSSYWWAIGDSKSRIMALNTIISNTKNKLAIEK